jgi:hypothetical protein
VTLHINDRRIIQLLQSIASLKGKTMEEALHDAVEHLIERERKRRPSSRPLKAIQDQFSHHSRQIKRFQPALWGTSKRSLLP